jgi:hypothetical protein
MIGEVAAEESEAKGDGMAAPVELAVDNESGVSL